MRYGLFERPQPPRRRQSRANSHGGVDNRTSDDHHLNLMVMEVVGKLIRSLSSLLESKAFPAWRDLPYGERKRTIWRFMRSAEDLGSVIPLMTRLPIPEGATITSDNICKCWEENASALVKSIPLTLGESVAIKYQDERRCRSVFR